MRCWSRSQQACPPHASTSCCRRSPAIVRVMPNTPALVRQAASVVAAGPRATVDHLALVEEMLAPLGTVRTLPESSIDAVTALSGSGPAYVFLLAEALAEAGVLNGLSREDAVALATQTVAGAGALLTADRGTPAELREQVTSPGGTTAAALQVLERAGFRAARARRGLRRRRARAGAGLTGNGCARSGQVGAGVGPAVVWVTGEVHVAGTNGQRVALVWDEALAELQLWPRPPAEPGPGRADRRTDPGGRPARPVTRRPGQARGRSTRSRCCGSTGPSSSGPCSGSARTPSAPWTGPFGLGPGDTPAFKGCTRRRCWWPPRRGRPHGSCSRARRSMPSPRGEGCTTPCLTAPAASASTTTRRSQSTGCSSTAPSVSPTSTSTSTTATGWS